VGLREEQSERAKVHVDACACAGMRGCVDVQACLCCAFVKVQGSEQNRWPNTLFLLAVIFVAAIVTDMFISNGPRTPALASNPRCYLHVLERKRGENTGIEIDTHLKPSASNAEEPEEVVAYELVEGQRCNSSLPAAFMSLNHISWNLGWQM
jgi:hypothetical protein